MGLITFGEAELLHDANESTLMDKMSVCSFITHEIAQVSGIHLIILFMLFYFINLLVLLYQFVSFTLSICSGMEIWSQ